MHRIGHFLVLGGKYIILISALACASITALPGNAVTTEKQAPADDAAGWNLFSIEQDIQLGNESADRFEEAVQLVQDPKLNDYFNRLGDRLTSTLPQEHFPFSFRLIADGSLHAFSFPGGPVYCTAGMMAAAENEAQLAGLVAHQMAHIVLRDATSTASRMKRFRVRAAMAVASTGKKSLLDSLGEIGLYLTPGSELMRYDTESEIRATTLAAKLMAEAGYKPLEADIFFQNLQMKHDEMSEFYLARHPVLDLDDLATSQAMQGKPSRLVSKRKYRRLRKQAAAIQATSEQLEALVNWQPPEQEQVASAGPREIYIASSYSFSYPTAWKEVKSSGADKFQVTPKGGAVRLANGERMVTVGVIAGPIDPGKQTRPGKNRLLELVEEIRPGLTMVSGLERITTDSRPLEGMVLEGLSPVSGERETVWIVSARLADRVFYLLMVAPEKGFAQMQPEFDAILASIEFSDIR